LTLENCFGKIFNLKAEKDVIFSKRRTIMKKVLTVVSALYFIFPSVLRASECIDAKKELASVQSSTLTNETFEEKKQKLVELIQRCSDGTCEELNNLYIEFQVWLSHLNSKNNLIRKMEERVNKSCGSNNEN
jgi:hypothetical protein